MVQLFMYYFCRYLLFSPSDTMFYKVLILSRKVGYFKSGNIFVME